MNEGERRLMEFQRRAMDMNSFFGLLFRAIGKADTENKYKLQTAFPEEVSAHIRWTMEDGYAEALALEYDGGRP